MAAREPLALISRVNQSRSVEQARQRFRSVDLEAFCDGWLDAWSGGDGAGLLSYYAPDAYYEDPARPHGLRGHGELAPYFTRLLSRYPDWHWQRERLWPLADGRGFSMRHTATIPLPDGSALTERAMDVVVLDAPGKKIVHNEVFFDRHEWFRRLE